eukprot:407102_1
MSMCPFSEISVEESVKLKENKEAKVSEVIALSIGPKQCTETLRQALAMGCDRGLHITTDKRGDYMELQSDGVAKIFEKVLRDMEPDVDLVLVGKQAIDSDCGQVGPMLAGKMGWPQATFAANIDLDGDGLKVERETDSGTEFLKIPKLPAVISCDLRLNEPRYVTLPNIMKAKKKKIATVAADSFDIDLEVSLLLSCVRACAVSLLTLKLVHSRKIKFWKFLNLQQGRKAFLLMMSTHYWIN